MHRRRGSPIGYRRPWMACIVCAASGSAMAQAGDGSTIYGRINVAVESTDLRPGATARMSRLSNYRSVVGFRGTEDLGDGLKALWQLEGALSLDTGVGSFSNRDTRVGLSGPWGTAFAGVWTLPYTSATSSFDPFYPTTAGYMGLMGNGSAPTTDNVIDNSAFDRRQRNVVQYWSPQFRGLSARVAYAFNEETVAATGARPSLLSLSLTATSGEWLVTAAHEIHNRYHEANGSDTGSKLGLAYSAGTVRLAGAVELRYETAGGVLTRNAAYVSATWKAGAGTLQAGYAKALDGHGSTTETVGFISNGEGTGATQWTVGGEYALSRRTALFVFYSRIANESGAAYDFAINGTSPAMGQQPSVVAAGMRHSF